MLCILIGTKYQIISAKTKQKERNVMEKVMKYVYICRIMQKAYKQVS